tara:strand:+ start:410 stop:808 length:399 start_codon:yes stop_codon:yes gene_type:complete
MKKSELKHLIKECVKEVLFDEGVLSNLVAEVAFGITKAQTQLLESKETAPAENLEEKAEIKEEKRKRLLETKRKMLNAIGSDKMKGIFEGTEPLRSGKSSQHSPMSGKDPTDAGVDISGLFGLAGQKWKQLK